MTTFAPAAAERGTIVVNTSGTLSVDVRGTIINAVFVGSYVPALGDNVQVLISDGAAYVLGQVQKFVPPRYGTVTGSTSTTVTLSTTAGTITAHRASGTAPSNGTVMFIDWSSTTPYALDPVAAAPDIPFAGTTAPPAPRKQSTTGVLSLAASASGSYRPTYSKWEAGRVRQGAYSSADYKGSWWYSQSALKSLAGKTITRVQFRLSNRELIGSFNSSVTVTFYRRSNGPVEASPTTTVGPHNESVAARAAAHWIDLPTSFGDALKTGGGITIGAGAGEAYAGFAGRDADPASGQLKIDWKV